MPSCDMINPRYWFKSVCKITNPENIEIYVDAMNNIKRKSKYIDKMTEEEVIKIVTWDMKKKVSSEKIKTMRQMIDKEKIMNYINGITKKYKFSVKDWFKQIGLDNDQIERNIDKFSKFENNVKSLRSLKRKDVLKILLELNEIPKNSFVDEFTHSTLNIIMKGIKAMQPHYDILVYDIEHTRKRNGKKAGGILSIGYVVLRLYWLTGEIELMFKRRLSIKRKIEEFGDLGWNSFWDCEKMIKIGEEKEMTMEEHKSAFEEEYSLNLKLGEFKPKKPYPMILGPKSGKIKLKIKDWSGMVDASILPELNEHKIQYEVVLNESEIKTYRVQMIKWGKPQIEQLELFQKEAKNEMWVFQEMFDDFCMICKKYPKHELVSDNAAFDIGMITDAFHRLDEEGPQYKRYWNKKNKTFEIRDSSYRCVIDSSSLYKGLMSLLSGSKSVTESKHSKIWEVDHLDNEFKKIKVKHDHVPDNDAEHIGRMYLITKYQLYKNEKKRTIRDVWGYDKDVYKVKSRRLMNDIVSDWNKIKK